MMARSMREDIQGILIVCGAAIVMSLLSILRHRQQRFRDGLLIAGLSYVLLYAVDILDEGYLDPFFLIALPPCLGAGLTIYFVTYWLFRQMASRP
jgi:lipopolysaccharide export LptBFGC system permease protein LptF